MIFRYLGWVALFAGIAVLVSQFFVAFYLPAFRLAVFSGLGLSIYPLFCRFARGPRRYRAFIGYLVQFLSTWLLGAGLLMQAIRMHNTHLVGEHRFALGDFFALLVQECGIAVFTAASLLLVVRMLWPAALPAGEAAGSG